MIKIIPKEKLALKDNQINDFWDLVRAGYRSKRKFLLSNLKSYTKVPKKDLDAAWGKLGLDKKIRPENLSLDIWLELFKIID